MKSSHRLLLVASLGALVHLAGYPVPKVAADHCSRGQGTLSGPAINGVVPSGKAEWRGNSFCQPLEMRVEVGKVDLPDGTVLTVDACGSGGTSNPIGTVTLRGGSGRLELSKLDGDPSNDNVPFCDMRFGGSVNILWDGAVILSGCVSSPTIPGAPKC